MCDSNVLPTPSQNRERARLLVETAAAWYGDRAEFAAGGQTEQPTGFITTMVVREGPGPFWAFAVATLPLAVLAVLMIVWLW